MKKTRRSLFFLAGYLLPSGLCLLLAPQWFLKALFANHEYSDAFPQFAGVLMIGLAVVVISVIRKGNPFFYRMTLLIRIPIWLGTLYIYLHTGETFFLAILAVLGLGMLITGSMYFLERGGAPAVMQQ